MDKKDAGEDRADGNTRRSQKRVTVYGYNLLLQEAGIFRFLCRRVINNDMQAPSSARTISSYVDTDRHNLDCI